MRLVEHTSNNLLARPTIMLALIFFAIFALKVILTGCGFWGKEDCNQADQTSDKLRNELNIINSEIVELKRSMSEIECQETAAPKANENASIDVPAWQEGKIEALSGCWSLDWKYTMQYVKTKMVVGVKYWNICFDPGNDIGSQTLEFQNNVSCSNQQILGKFEKNNFGLQTLLLDDTKNLQCTDNVTVLRRKLNCVLAENGSHAMCSQTTRDENGNWSAVIENMVKLSRK